MSIVHHRWVHIVDSGLVISGAHLRRPDDTFSSLSVRCTVVFVLLKGYHVFISSMHGLNIPLLQAFSSWNLHELWNLSDRIVRLIR